LSRHLLFLPLFPYTTLFRSVTFFAPPAMRNDLTFSGTGTARARQSGQTTSRCLVRAVSTAVVDAASTPLSISQRVGRERDSVHADRKSTRLNSSHLGTSYAV